MGEKTFFYLREKLSLSQPERADSRPLEGVGGGVHGGLMSDLTLSPTGNRRADLRGDFLRGRKLSTF